MTKTILCATDGSVHASKAISFATDLARVLGAKLVIIAIEPLNMGRASGVPAWDEAAVDAALGEAVAHAKAVGVIEVVADKEKAQDIAEAVIDIALDKNADQIVVGSGAKTLVQRTLLGSVSSAIIHRAHCPVTVVR